MLPSELGLILQRHQYERAAFAIGCDRVFLIAFWIRQRHGKIFNTTENFNNLLSLTIVCPFFKIISIIWRTNGNIKLQLPSTYITILPHWYIMLYCCTTILLYCYISTLLDCHTTTLHSYRTILSQCCIAILSHCYITTVCVARAT